MSEVVFSWAGEIVVKRFTHPKQGECPCLLLKPDPKRKPSPGGEVRVERDFCLDIAGGEKTILLFRMEENPVDESPSSVPTGDKDTIVDESGGHFFVHTNSSVCFIGVDSDCLDYGEER